MKSKILLISENLKNDFITESEAHKELLSLFNEKIPNKLNDYLSLSGAFLYDMIPEHKIEIVKEKLKKMNDDLLDFYN